MSTHTRAGRPTERGDVGELSISATKASNSELGMRMASRNTPYMMPKSAIMALRNLGVTLKRSARGPAFTS